MAPLLGEEAGEGMDKSVFVVGVGSASTSIGTSGLEARNDFSGGVGVDGVAEGMVAGRLPPPRADGSQD